VPNCLVESFFYGKVLTGFSIDVSIIYWNRINSSPIEPSWLFILRMKFLRKPILIQFTFWSKIFSRFFPYLFGSSHNSVNTPKVDFGCKKAMFSPSAPFRGVLSMRSTPRSAAKSSLACNPSTANAM